MLSFFNTDFQFSERRPTTYYGGNDIDNDLLPEDYDDVIDDEQDGRHPNIPRVIEGGVYGIESANSLRDKLQSLIQTRCDTSKMVVTLPLIVMKVM